jgi:nucleotide-binding universal stress UspA family protein
VRQALDLFPGADGLGYPAERIVAVGNPAEEIVRLARRDGHDLILMPTHGAGAVKRWLLVGSVTTKILHAADCAVLAATDFDGRGEPPRRVVCALDLGQHSPRVLCAAVGLARHTGADLTVVHAVPSAGESLAEYFDESWRATLKSRATGGLNRLLEEARAAGQIVVEAGPPEKVVSEAAARAGAGLIVAGRASSNGVFGRLRAHTYEIIRHAPCPVLTV